MNKSKCLKVFLLVFSLGFIFSCGGGGYSAHSPSPSVNATGTWHGSYNSTVFGTQTMTLNIQQNGAALTGTYSSSTGATGTISGTVSDNTASFTITVTTSGCSGNFDGTGIIDTQANPNTMSFQYNGSSTCGGNESGTGNLTKQY